VIPEDGGINPAVTGVFTEKLMLPEILGVPYFQTTQIICWDGVEPTKLGDLMWEPSTF